MNVLVLGGTGFIGSNLCKSLLIRGHKIRIIDRTIKNIGFDMTNIECVEADFIDIIDFKPYLKNIDVVYHLISTTVPATSNMNRYFDVNSNVCTTIRLLDDIVKSNAQKIIFLSSGGTIYGQTEITPIPEDHPTNPICSYGIQKLTIEKYLFFYFHEYGLDYQVVRLSNPYGKGQNGRKGQGVIPIFINKVLKNEEIQIWGDGLTIRDYIYIDDVIEALSTLLEYSGEHRILNLGSGKGSTLIDIINIISSVTGQKALVSFTEARSIDVRANVLDIKKTTKELKWEPKYSLSNGIKLYIDKI
ncbi:NAD-dependent epimerase/dehydratase family protein [Paenibacillus hexagrammi]|uniref:NAD-dependent epimerase/dehydratase family protein n=1 Tax=Paenibacillus hexagrammi TaxID=2908839 RepID=A0ABY3SJR1_9BACL|nr:NAD-dependent epimerase/dehydratase family protein [Paenibacillus sp. YPD9-1]UJF34268.1 NAD-dependent epimerase/dehydratase family protein [Paenibacillus sp. YPD9-1]